MSDDDLLAAAAELEKGRLDVARHRIEFFEEEARYCEQQAAAARAQADAIRRTWGLSAGEKP